MSSTFHEGERAVQREAGTVDQAARLSRTVRSDVPVPLSRFLTALQWVVLGAPDAAGRIWASPVVGTAGFAEAVGETSVRLHGRPDADDPLHAVGGGHRGVEAGLLAIDFERRMRARINGLIHVDGDGLVVTIDQCFANCTKYIQRRLQRAAGAVRHVGYIADSRIPAEMRALVATADTAFIATVAPGHGADASHRGGLPGFLVCSPDGASIRFADYPGNGMFNTLGNLRVDSRAGLTIPDFRTGGFLQLTGHARVDEKPDSVRTVEFAVESAIYRSGVVPWEYDSVEYSPAAHAVHASYLPRLWS